MKIFRDSCKPVTLNSFSMAIMLLAGLLALPATSFKIALAAEAEVDSPTVQCENPNVNVSAPDIGVSAPNPSRLVPNIGRILREGVGVPAPDSEAPDVGSPSASASAPEVCEDDTVHDDAL